MASEMRGFVFCITFILIFSGLLSTIPTGLQGAGNTPSDLIPVDPSILTEFTDGENYTRAAFSGVILIYEYVLGGKTWLCSTDETAFMLASKVLFWILWLGQLDYVNFGDRGDTLTFAEIDEDADDGRAKYTLQHVDSGQSAGGFIAYWNTTTYDNSTHAWDNDKLYLLHGVGLENTATTDIGSLLVGLLLLQLPEIPTLVNLLLAVPLWASIVYVLWFIIKEMIPFL